MSETFKVCNVFGITPTKSYKAAGWDFYIPNITDASKFDRAINELKKSYKKSDKEIEVILQRMEKEMTLTGREVEFQTHKVNLLHLFLALDGAVMRTSQNKVSTFCQYYLTWVSGLPGVKLHCNDHLFINSGIKTCLDPGTAGVFLNKSGMGNRGFDVRAQVVDEDYAGFVHLSVAYTKDNMDCGIVYVGDKAIQMLILPIIQKSECEELVEEYYDQLMSYSERGDAGFGSTDVKR